MTAKRGRPRNPDTQQSIITASYELLLEEGFASVTVEKIAERAGVSKATIYKWWPGKAAVVMDGFLAASTERLPVPDTGSVREDIRIHATNLARFLTSREGRVIKELIGEGQFDPKVAEAYRARYFHPRRLEAKQMLERGIRRGELKKELDTELCIDLMYGPIFYQLLVLSDTLEETYVENIVRSAFAGIAPDEQAE